MEEPLLIERLSEEARALLGRIVAVNDEKYRLPHHSGHTRFGFGQFEGFYMFWVAERKNGLYFFARRVFVKKSSKNRTRILFVPSNEGAILAAMETIYQSYHLYLKDPDAVRLPQKTKRHAMTPERAGERAEGATESREPTTGVAPTAIRAETPSRPKSQRPRSRWLLLREELLGAEGVPPELVLAEAATMPPTETAEAITSIVEKIAHRLWEITDGARETRILFEFVKDDTVTLETLGVAYGVTRERIRQLILKGERRFGACFARMSATDPTLKLLTDELCDRLVGERAEGKSPLAVLGFSTVGKHRQTLYRAILFGSPLANLMKRVAPKYERTATIKGEWEALYKKVVFPSDSRQPAPRVSSRSTTASPIAARFERKLAAFSGLVSFVPRPDLVYHSTEWGEYHPDVLLETSRGECILVLLATPLEMAAYHNRERFNALHVFCRLRGYGYLIIDENATSIYELREERLPPEVAEAMDAVLNRRGRITKDDISHLRLQFSITRRLLATYALNRHLDFFPASLFFCRRGDRKQQ